MLQSITKKNMVFAHCMKIDFFSKQNLLISCVFVICSTIEEYAAEDFVSRKNVNLYYDFKTLINGIFSEENAEKYKTQLLFIKYDKECLKEKHTHLSTEKRKPFIELECNNATAKKILLEKLAKRIRGVVLEHPAQCLREVASFYVDEHPLYGPFCSLSMYVTAYDATVRFHDTPVITSGYWLEKAAYFINKAYENQSLPVYGSPVYDYPRDLLLPDIAFSIHYEDLPGVPNTLVRRHQEAMSKIDGPVMFEIKPYLTLDAMVSTMLYEMIKGLTRSLDLQFIVEQ